MILKQKRIKHRLEQFGMSTIVHYVINYPIATTIPLCIDHTMNKQDSHRTLNANVSSTDNGQTIDVHKLGT